MLVLSIVKANCTPQAFCFPVLSINWIIWQFREERRQEVSSPTSFSRQVHQPLGQNRLLRAWFSLVLKPARDRGCTNPLSNLFQCWIASLWGSSLSPLAADDKMVFSITEILLLKISSLRLLTFIATYHVKPCSHLTATHLLIAFVCPVLLTTTPSPTLETACCFCLETLLGFLALTLSFVYSLNLQF